MKIGILQLNPVAGDLEANAEMIFEAVGKVAAQGAELCISSELIICGYPPTDLLLRKSFVEKCRNVLRALAQRLKDASLPPVLVGAPIANPAPQGKGLHNCAVLLRDGKMVVIARKVILPADGSHDDHHYFEPGIACGALQYKGWRFAVSVGEDVWNDRSFWQNHRISDIDPIEEFMGGGADALINLTAIAYSQGMPDMHQGVLAWTASRYRVPVFSVNQSCCADGIIYNGGSMVFNGNGVLVDEAASFSEDVRVISLSDESMAYLEPKPRKVPRLEDELWQALTFGVRDFVYKSGFSKVVLGLSGGVDSALVAAIAAEALGAENVLGILLPSPYSSEGSVADARVLAANLGIEARTVEIGGVMRAYEEIWRNSFGQNLADAPGLAEENMQPRIRGNVLMAVSNAENRMLLNTGNKSESAVGYCTLYGDTCGGLAVISDLYKDQVYAVCRRLNEKKGRDYIPLSILEKEPSAELKPGQKDSDSLPPYPELDPILRAVIDQEKSPVELAKEGFNPDTVAQVARLMRKSEFKRYQAPPGLTVSAHSLGRGRHMPLTGGNW